MTGIFDTYAGLIWLDEVHVTPPGNRLMAAQVAEVLRTDPETAARLMSSAK
jgi:hypothetical protein